MTALSGGNPSRGVRYVFTLAEGGDGAALYDVEVRTAAATGRARVRVTRDGSALEGEAADVEAAHVAQLLALARTLGKRDEAGWPRRVERWRSPGVR